MKKPIAAAAALICISFAGAAYAETGIINAGVNVRAGPGVAFPRVSSLRPGARVDVRGCITTRDWCDVAFRGGRGWISTRYLDMSFNGRRANFWSNRSRAPVANLNWDLNSYWDQNYRGQSFNRDRERYRDQGPRPARSSSTGASAPPTPPRTDREQTSEQNCDDRRTPQREECPAPRRP